MVGVRAFGFALGNRQFPRCAVHHPRVCEEHDITQGKVRGVFRKNGSELGGGLGLELASNENA